MLLAIEIVVAVLVAVVVDDPDVFWLAPPAVVVAVAVVVVVAVDAPEMALPEPWLVLVENAVVVKELEAVWLVSEPVLVVVEVPPAFVSV